MAQTVATLRAVFTADTNQFKAGMQGVQRDIKNVERGTLGVNAATKTTTSLLGGMSRELKGLFAVGGVAGAIKLVDSMQQLGANALQSEIALRKLAGGSKEAEEWINAVRRATDGATTSGEAAAQAYQLMKFGFADTAEGAEDFMRTIRIVTAINPQLKNTDQTLQQLQLTLANTSYMRLDQLGMSVSVVKDRMAELKEETKGLTTEQAFQIAVMEGLDEQAAIVGDEILEVSNDLDWLKGKAKEFKEDTSKWIAEGANDMAGALRNASEGGPLDDAVNRGGAPFDPNEWGKSEIMGYYNDLSAGAANWLATQNEVTQTLFENMKAFPDAPMDSWQDFMTPDPNDPEWNSQLESTWSAFGFTSADAFWAAFESYGSADAFVEAAFRGSIGEMYIPMSAAPNTSIFDERRAPYRGTGSYSYSGLPVTTTGSMNMLSAMFGTSDMTELDAILSRNTAEREAWFNMITSRRAQGHGYEESDMFAMAQQQSIAAAQQSMNSITSFGDTLAGALGNAVDAAGDLVATFDSLDSKFGVGGSAFDKDVYGEMADALRGVEIDAGAAEEAMSAFEWATGLATGSSVLFDDRLGVLTQRFADGEMTATEYADAVRQFSMMDFTWVDKITQGMDFDTAQQYIDAISNLTTFTGFQGGGMSQEEANPWLAGVGLGGGEETSIFQPLIDDAATATGDITASFATATDDMGNDLLEFHNLHTGEYQSLAVEASGALETIRQKAQAVMGGTYTMTITTGGVESILGNKYGSSSGYTPIPPGRAAGGPVSAGQAYIVGEDGPELFVPGASGSIVSNGGGRGMSMSGTGTVIYIERIEASDPMTLLDTIKTQAALQGMRVVV